jgi:hypothetical protein
MKKQALTSPEELEKFEFFLFEMDDVLEEFIDQARIAGYRLDYTLESLEVLESYLASHPNAKQDERLKNRAARYLGEVFRKNVGGKWELCLDGPQFAYFKLPVISGWAKMPLSFCPIEIIENCLVRPGEGILKRAVEANLPYRK